MATRVEELPGAGGRRSRRSYDWNSWFDGKPWHLTRGVDYDVATRAMRSYVYRAACDRGLKVATVRDTGDTGITIQAVREPPVAAAA